MSKNITVIVIYMCCVLFVRLNAARTTEAEIGNLSENMMVFWTEIVWASMFRISVLWKNISNLLTETTIVSKSSVITQIYSLHRRERLTHIN